MTVRPSKLSSQKRFLLYLILLLIPTTASLAIYVAYVAHRAAPLYWYIKQNQRSWKGEVHQADPELGHAPVPGSRGAEIFPLGADIPARYDEEGFRVPLQEPMNKPPGHRPLILALGCSFTYGAATVAENTYPYLAGQYLEAVAKNAGVPSYGLSQMLVLARRLIPAYRPDYVLVQYSPWLVQRAQSPFAPSYFGRLPTPYFIARNDSLVLHPPVFRTKILDLPIDRYRNTPASLLDKVAFVWDIGLPLFLHDDLKMSYHRLSKAFGQTPEPAADSDRVNRHVYEEIAGIARAYGARLVIVILGNDHNPVRPVAGLFPPDALIVDAHAQLLERLPAVDAETYARSYYHWRGSPSRMVDDHPNGTAHRVVAEAVARQIRDIPKAARSSDR